jgi:predicted 2-oxoglutarate/Fe(II)-dependent dioxygenase YbiX
MLKMKNLNEAILYCPKIFDKKWCDHLVKYADLVCTQKGRVVKKNKENDRKVFVYGLGTDKQESMYKAHIYETISTVLKKYKDKFKFLSDLEITDVDLLKYPKNHFYKAHVDNSITTPRTLSVIINLNQQYIGGELFFCDQGENLTKTYELKTGDLIMFPSNFLFPHGVLPIIQGVRYSIITWLK